MSVSLSDHRCDSVSNLDKKSDWLNYLDEAKQAFLNNMPKGPPRDSDVQLSDFIFIKTLGQGGFGKVMLVELNHNRPGNYFAAKVQEKQSIVESKQVSNILNELRLLESIKFPFILKLEYFFQDNVYLYFILPYMEGGDLFNVLRIKGKFDEDVSRFYSAQVLLALEYLHYLDLIYRDLKPENILLDRGGYLRVADFGFVKEVKDRTYTFCGTPEYIAPEVILDKGYGKSVDYWSFGILLYEFNSGTTPFYADNPLKTYEKIVAGKYHIKGFSSVLKDIIARLLITDPTKRYGTLKAGVDDIKDHPWFKPMIWFALVNKAFRPPFVPPIGGFFETFDEKPLEKSDTDPYHEIFANF